MSVISSQELENRGGYHPPSSPDKAKLHSDVREVYLTTARVLNVMLPPCRESELALEHLLDYSLMLANAALARRVP
jgi:hypothetical protein